MLGNGTMNWDDFVLVDTIDFADGEDEGLLPPMEEHLLLEDRRGDHVNKKKKVSPRLELDQDPKYKYLKENIVARMTFDTSEELSCKRIVGPKEAFEFQVGVGARVPYPPPKLKPGVRPVPPPPGVDPTDEHAMLVASYARIRKMMESPGEFIS